MVTSREKRTIQNKCYNETFTIAILDLNVEVLISGNKTDVRIEGCNRYLKT